MSKYTKSGAVIILQCCHCKLPEYPAGTPQEAQSHGEHSQCFSQFYSNPEMGLEPAEVQFFLDNWKITIPGDALGPVPE